MPAPLPTCVVPPIASTALPPQATSSPSVPAPHFRSQPVSKQFTFIELCSGSSRLTATMAAIGWHAIAVDHKHNRHSTLVQPVCIDLSAPTALQHLLAFVATRKIDFIHAGLPCGTCSRARERAVPQHLRQRGAPCPPPLRSTSHPQGLPGLTTTQQAQVASANAVYHTCCSFMRHCALRGCAFSIENPANSHLWAIPCVTQLLKDFPHHRYQFHNCAFGGRRKKLSAWCSTLPLPGLNVLCPGTHEHLPWGAFRNNGRWLFHTADEAAYDQQLCDFIASAINFHFSGNHPVLPAAVAKQARGRQSPTLLPENFDLVEFHGPSPPIAIGRRLTAPWMSLPLHAKLLASTTHGTFQKPDADQPLTPQHCSPTAETTAVHSTWSIPFSAKEFAQRALELPHPFDSRPRHDMCIENMLAERSHLSDAEVVLLRASAVMKWSSRRTQLTESETELKDKMPTQMRRIVEDKRILLFKEMLEAINYEDKDVWKILCEGTKLTGHPDRSNIFRVLPGESELSEADLDRSAVLFRSSVDESTGPAAEPDDDRFLWEECLKEVSEGWLDGPYSSQQITQLLGTESWTCSRRFVIKQTLKRRVIDDYSASGVNSAFHAGERVHLMGIDDIIGLARTLKESAPPSTRWLGKTVDLAAAYRQVPISSGSSRYCILVVFCCESKSRKYFRQLALPFGSRASVHAFLRLSYAIRRIAVQLFHIPLTVYFDDFVLIEAERLASSAQSSMAAMMKLLGWKVARAPGKDKPFSGDFDALGASFNLQHPQAVAEISNKASRVRDITNLIDEIIVSGKISSGAASSLRGKLLYAESHTYCRWGRLFLAPIAMRAMSSGIAELDDVLVSALAAAKKFLAESRPRLVLGGAAERPVVVFTDGAFEGKDSSTLATVGGAIYEPRSGGWQHFCEEVPEALVRLWTQPGHSQPIGQIELFAVLVAKMAWEKWLTQRKSIFFIDNSSAVEGLIKGTSQSALSQAIIEEVITMDARSESASWYARVPSVSNIADGPSRFDDKELVEAFGSKRIHLGETIHGFVARGRQTQSGVSMPALELFGLLCVHVSHRAMLESSTRRWTSSIKGAGPHCASWPSCQSEPQPPSRGTKTHPPFQRRKYSLCTVLLKSRVLARSREEIRMPSCKVGSLSHV